MKIILNRFLVGPIGDGFVAPMARFEAPHRGLEQQTRRKRRASIIPEMSRLITFSTDKTCGDPKQRQEVVADTVYP